ncbi:MAG TPA: N-acetylmuramoyl-L-alanine amidase, partial [Candidatus Negativibacillus faecipullorum]|nr:N-acetylmuramoyl-L-alanine amidase [Candidatus Negativibacillus faecipullorum]
EQASSRGAQIFFSPNNPESQKLAQSIQETFASLLQPENTRQIKQAENNLFLLYEAQIPAVMAECGFLSNPQEASLLQDQTYQQQVAFTIFCGLMDYLAAE